MSVPGGATRWDHARAALLALVLLGHGVYALPLPPALSKSRVQEPSFQRDVDLWLGVARRVGLDPSRGDVERWMLSTTGELHHVHEVLKTPFRPVMDLVGANQAWALFASTTTNPDRLEVSIRTEDRGPWKVVLRRMDPCCTWREEALEYRRIRGVWDGQRKSMRAGYKGLTKWIAARAFEDFPEARTVRVRLVRSTLVLPGEPPIDEISFEHERIHQRGSAP